MYSSAAAQGFDPVHDTPEPREVEAFRAAVLSKLRYNVAKEPSHARDHDWLLAVSLAARDHVIDRWSETTRRTYRDGRKRVYYFSLEFLVGRMLFDALSNLGLAATAIAALDELGVDFERIRRLEPDPALGNGGLGRLAACFMESMAALSIPAHGYGIRYDHGIFRQVVRDGWQQEMPEEWLTYGNPWEFERPEVTCTVGFGGTVVHSDGRDLNVRFRPNYRDPATGLRRLSDLDIRPNTQAIRLAINGGESQYDAIILGIRRRMTDGVDFSASYTFSSATSNIGTASDELDANYVQDVTNPFAEVQQGPSGRSDAHHRISVSAVIHAPWGLQVSPFFLFRSALPIFTFEGVDLNGDSNNNDITAKAYQYDGEGVAAKETGTCKTINCSRGASFSQLNLRISKSFPLGGRARVEGIAEIFNVFNALNPAFPLTSQRLAGGVQRANFMQPTAFAGDFQQPEQRVGQLGFRFTF